MAELVLYKNNLREELKYIIRQAAAAEKKNTPIAQIAGLIRRVYFRIFYTAASGFPFALAR